ncbi:MAG: NifU family protein [Staphylococcus epidermidis]|nr:NifU family protein [Staphylococcus epidermidis]
MPTENPTMFDQVAEVIERLRPFACGTCPSSTITLKAGIERALHEEVPGVIEVEQVF